MTKASQILSHALRLPQSQRALLAKELVLSLEKDFDSDAGSDWSKEIRRRSDALHNGSAKTRDAKDAIKRARAQLPSRTAG
jgi:Putative addiction module component